MSDAYELQAEKDRVAYLRRLKQAEMYNDRYYMDPYSRRVIRARANHRIPDPLRTKPIGGME